MLSDELLSRVNVEAASWTGPGDLGSSNPTRHSTSSPQAAGAATALGYNLIAFGVALFAVIVLAALKYIAHRLIGEDDDAAPAEGKQNRPGRKNGKSAHT